MNRINELFDHKKKNILNVYCTAGFPDLNSTIPVMKALQKNGADLIELGMPYSDPLADGPVIQESSARAISNGMTIAELFSQLEQMRASIHIPVILMGYLNPILQYGLEKFCSKAQASGIDGLIIPDIPMFEYEKDYKDIFEKFGLNFIFLVTPETSNERIYKLDALSKGFLYAVSSSSITGTSKDFSPVEAYLEKLDKMKLINPILVGFGISDRKSYLAATKHAAGGIIGSAYIRALEKGADIEQSTAEFITSITGSLVTQ